MITLDERALLGLDSKIEVVWRNSDGNGEEINAGLYRKDSGVDVIGDTRLIHLRPLDLEQVSDSGLIRVTRESSNNYLLVDVGNGDNCYIEGEPKGYTHFKLGREFSTVIETNVKRVVYWACPIDFYREKQEEQKTKSGSLDDEFEGAEDLPF
jgi:hypothetical protein